MGNGLAAPDVSGRGQVLDRVALAVGIASPGSFAKVYGADNKTIGYADIGTAVAMANSGLDGAAAYTVLPDADVGPCIDIDLPRELDRVTKAGLAPGTDLSTALIGFERSIQIQLWMLDRLREVYLQVREVAKIAILPSGRGAHALIVGFEAAAKAQLLDHVGRLQEELRGRLVAARLPATEAAFEIKSYCRPPGSPHRLEGDLGIPLFRLAGLEPEHEAEQGELLTSMAERGRLRIAEGVTAPVFPARLNELLQEGRVIGARLDLFLRIAVRGGLRLEHAHQVLQPLGYRAEPVGPAWYRRLGTRWQRALDAAARIDQALAEIRAEAEAYDWSYRAGETDKRVLLAYIRLAEEEARLTMAPGDRRVAEEAPCSASAVGRSNKRLRDRGWIKRCRSARIWGREAAVWRLGLPRVRSWAGNARRLTNEVLAAGDAFSPPMPPLAPGTGGESASVSAKSSAHDVWQALPSRAPDVWEQLTEHTTAIAAVAAAIKLSPRRTLELLKALESAGLAIRTRGQASRGRPRTLWTSGPMTLDEAATRIGAAGASQDRRKTLRMRHAEERARFHEALQGPRPHMPLAG